jgi:hypothetical protein
MNLPTVTNITSALDARLGCRTYLLIGGDVRADWLKGVHPPDAPWCEITVWSDLSQVGSYGGTVWPSAWPALFESHRGTAQSGPFTIITELGQELLRCAPALSEPAAA